MNARDAQIGRLVLLIWNGDIEEANRVFQVTSYESAILRAILHGAGDAFYPENLVGNGREKLNCSEYLLCYLTGRLMRDKSVQQLCSLSTLIKEAYKLKDIRKETSKICNVAADLFLELCRYARNHKIESINVSEFFASTCWREKMRKVLTLWAVIEKSQGKGNQKFI
jgi:hypothetical protein